jgi:hypothetical protein
MPPFPIIAFLTGMLVSAVYPAAIVIFWGLVYVTGCIIIVVKSPKICKGIFAGSCSLGLLVGGALTAVTSAAMGLGRVGAATGAFGAGTLGQAASTIFDVPLPGSDAAGPGKQAGTGGASQPGSKPRPASMEAILATGAPTTGHQAMGGASRLLKKQAKITNPKAPNAKEI